MAEKMNFIDVSVRHVKSVTPKAVLIILEETGEEKWVPRSTLSTADDESIFAGMQNQTIRVHGWFAYKEGLV